MHIVLVHPEIPHNTGAIGRLCVGLDAKLHLVRPLGFALTDRFIKRAGLDYWPHLDLQLHADWPACVTALGENRLWFATTHSTHSLYDCRFQPGDALVFGSESSGLPEEIRTPAPPHRSFAIPMPGKQARSLNLAQAAAIAAYEMHRQITTP